MRNLKTSYLIHLFALLHAIVAFICASYLISDQLILTLLTIVLTVIICVRRNADIEFTAASVILVNIIGFLFGTFGAKLVSSIIPDSAFSRALSSFLTTEIMGWSIYLFAKFTVNSDSEEKRKKDINQNIKGFFIIILIFLALRIIYTIVFHSDLYVKTHADDIISDYFVNPMVFLITICLNIIFINQMEKGTVKTQSKGIRVGLSILFFLVITCISAFLACLGLHFNMSKIQPLYYQQMLVIASIIELTAFTIIYMIYNFISYRTEMFREREIASQARYQYMMLKQQVDPHFLYNSLNILDCLVIEKKTEQASTYIHKLAGLYRYMLKNEQEVMVDLRDELIFANMYIDLLKVRFEEGFKVEFSIPEEMMGKQIVPCTLQLLIENAIKHNIVKASDPLIIHIEAFEDHIVVTNNIFPKITDQNKSNKMGLKYIDIQYKNLVGKHIQIIHDEKIHQVIIPFK